jgi:Nif-specific regulatory protein
LRRSKAESDPTAEPRRRLGAHEFVGRSRALANLLRDVEGVARLDVGVLIVGETGTGKTQLARLIHRNSQRANGPFVELNCGAVQENLLEADLFGSLPGAYTGAIRREGKIAAAEGGTLLLDDVAELTLSAQAKLLQLLQDQQYYVLGATRPTAANVRVIAATHVDLRQAVDERRFREDLYYRLKVIPIRVPSLAERREDLRVLATHFCAQVQREHRLSELELSPAALRAIETADWNGNVRELRNQLLNAAVRASAEGCARIEVSHLFPERSSQRSEPATSTFQSETRAFQRQLLSRVLEETDWNVAATARRLDLTRAHVYNLIKSFGLER